MFPEVTNGDEKQAIQCISDLRTIQTSSTPIAPKNTTESKSELDKLRTQLTHYQSVVSETESMLTTLENHVKAEERHWRSELAARDAEILNLTRDTKILSEELESQLESERHKRQQLEEEILKRKAENATTFNGNAQVHKLCAYFQVFSFLTNAVFCAVKSFLC